MVRKVAYEEMILLSLHNLNQLMPHHWSELVMLAYQLLDPEEINELQDKIFEVEKMVLETELIKKEDDKGKTVWMERIKGDLSLYDIEMAIESNPDYYAFFERDDGTKISKFDIERRLNRIKEWIYTKVRVRSEGRRFARTR